jgi:hypothetical protein
MVHINNARNTDRGGNNKYMFEHPPLADDQGIISTQDK